MAFDITLSPVPVTGTLPSIRKRLSEHWMRLSARSRWFRFLTAIQDRGIQSVASRVKPDAVIALDEHGELRGSLEIYLDGDCAEIAISVEDAYQGRGYGRTLFNAGLSHARTLGARTAHLTFSIGNHRIAALVNRVGGSICHRGTEAYADISLLE